MVDFDFASFVWGLMLGVQIALVVVAYAVIKKK